MRAGKAMATVTNWDILYLHCVVFVIGFISFSPPDFEL
jgi:hypothetical protein